jgi:photosystem II stability/assembly factor-like uncharacterized protein
MQILVATDRAVLVIDAERGTSAPARGISDRPTCLAADEQVQGRAWCGTHRGGVFRSDDGGQSWQATGLAGRLIMALAASPVMRDLVWAGTEPSEVWRTGDAGDSWEQTSSLETLPSSSEWSFPPRPDTHHVRWIGCHPLEPERLWVAIEAGALISTIDGGLTWRDRVRSGPWDTHELAIHRKAPDILRVSAGDGYYESYNAGVTWLSPRDGFEVGYFRSVAIDREQSDVVVASASSGPRSAYVAGRSDGRLYRRVASEHWERVRDGWPEPARTIAPLLSTGTKAGELWAADERGVHRSDDGGKSWRRVAGYAAVPQHLRGLALVRCMNTLGGAAGITETRPSDRRSSRQQQPAGAPGFW